MIMLLGFMMLVFVEWLMVVDGVPLMIQAAMTKGASEDLTTCLHYSDNWDPKDDMVFGMIYTMIVKF